MKKMKKMKKLTAFILTFFTVFSLSFPTLTSAKEYSKAEIREIIHQLKEEERQEKFEEEKRATARKDKKIEQAQGAAKARLTSNYANLVNTGDKIASLEYWKRLAKFILLPIAGIVFIGSIIYFRDDPDALKTVHDALDAFARIFLNERNINFRFSNR